MEFDWPLAIDRNSEALCAIAARLIVMAGIQAGRTVATLPRHLYRRILSLLRPAEYAARRLIVMAACKLVPDSGLPLATGARQRERSSKFRGGTDDMRPPFSPRGRRWMRAFRECPQTDEGDATDKAPSSGPSGHLLPRGEKEERVTFQLFDPFKRPGHPWLEPAGIAADEDNDFPPALPPDEPVDAKTLCRRIRALADALGDLEGQAVRLARWRARRHMESSRPRRWSPLRPGRPPGYRKRPKRPVEELLKDCHVLARDAWNTS
jgi:hypothetical protein